MTIFNPQSPFKKTLRVEVEAAQWTGQNLNEMKELLGPYVDGSLCDGPYVYAEYIEPYFLGVLGERGGYYMLKFYAGDDMEVDPGQWVVVYDDKEIEVMDEDQFKKMGFK
jgi:hypothetical protein